MKKITYMANLLAATVLSGCGSSHYDCASADTKDLIRELLAQGHDELMLHSTLLDTRIEGIVTEEADKEIGWYACRAEIIADLPLGGTRKADLEYEVSQVQSADADLEVAIDEETAERFAAAIRHTLNN